MKSARIAVAALAATLLAAGAAGATPTTNIWNPSTDVQAKGTWHLGIDNYFSALRNRTTPVAFPTDIGLTYGLGYGFEAGVDVFEPSKAPFVFNAKWALPERKGLPAIALGAQAVGTNATTEGNILYGLAAKTFGFGRITAGGYAGRKGFLGNDNSGAILAWDRSFGSKWWASVDYASGQNPYGEVSVGGSYKVAPNVSLLAGYVFLNDKRFNPNDTVTTQLDIDF